MKPKIFTTLPINNEVESYLKEYCDIRQWKGEGPVTRQTLLKEIADVEGLYTSGVPIDEELLSYAPKLRVVSNMSVGYNNFDLDAMKKRNVIGTNTPYVLDETVADLTFALMLSTARRIAELDKLVKEGKWMPSKDDKEYFGIDVHHTTLGIIGMGRIGEAIARRAKLGFNMEVIYHNRNQKPHIENELGITYCDFDSLLKQSDFVVLMTPLTDETFQLIGEREFKLMKDSAVFINVSRGQTVDEKALIKALQNKEIYGAGLDVFEQEPIEKDNPLLEMDNVVTVPHIGSATKQTRDAMAMRAAKNLVHALTNEGPYDKVSYDS